ncbi:short chain dehydrogenase, partial [Reticulomyxa filosa]
LKIVVIGGHGTIGKYIVKALKENDKTAEIWIGGRPKKDKKSEERYVDVDISDTKSVESFFSHVKEIDHLIISAGYDGPFGPVSKLTKEDIAKGFNSKAFGQIDVVLQAAKNSSINEKGTITLTTGMLDQLVVPLAAGLSAVNGAVNSFVRAVATEMPRGIRVNAVSPGLLVETVPHFGSVTRGFKPVEGPDVALAYIRSIYSGLSGRIFEVLGSSHVQEK